MAHTLGNSTYHEASANNSATVSHTVAAGSNRILVVGIIGQAVSGASPDVATVTYGGTGMTAVTSAKASTSDGQDAYWYYLLNPTVGAANIVVTVGASSNSNIQLWARDYSGHDGNAPVGGYTGVNNSGAAGSVTTASITEAVDTLTLTVAGCGAGSLTTTWTNGTELGDDTYSTLSASLAHRTGASAGSFTQTATFSGTGYQASISAIVLTPAVSYTITTDKTPYTPGTTIVVTKSTTWNGTVTATINGVSATVSNASGTTCNVAVPALSTFAPAQSHVATRWKQNINLVVTDTDAAMTAVIQIDPMPTATPYEDWSTKDATTWYGPTVPATWQTGDEIYGYYLTGYGQVEAGTGWFSPDPLGLPAQGRLICYDISAGQWLVGVNTDLWTAPGEGDTTSFRIYLSISLGL